MAPTTKRRFGRVDAQEGREPEDRNAGEVPQSIGLRKASEIICGLRVVTPLRPLHETIDHFLLPGLLERDGELVAVDLHHVAVAEFLVKHAIVEREFRNRAGGFGDQLAFDHHRSALVAREAAGRFTARGEMRLVLLKAATGRSVATVLIARAVGLRALPARRGVAGAEGFDIVEARGAVAAAPAG